MPKIKTMLLVYRADGMGGVVSLIRLKCRPLSRWVEKIISHVQDGVSVVLPPQDKKVCARDAVEYWSSSAESERIRDLSHWQDEGRWADHDKWQQIGSTHYARWESFKRSHGVVNKNGRMVEWGPGGGANVVQFAQEFNTIYGVDISASNLQECERQCVGRGIDSFHPVLIPANLPETCLQRIGGECDLFLCTAVFQHFPSKEYGVDVLRLVKTLLREGGGAIIQIRYDDLSRRYAAKNRNYKDHAITFTSYPIHEFWNLIVEASLMPCFVELQPAVNYAYFFIQNVV